VDNSILQSNRCRFHKALAFYVMSLTETNTF
jgi:hypothetical protein